MNKKGNAWIGWILPSVAIIIVLALGIALMLDESKHEEDKKDCLTHQGDCAIEKCLAYLVYMRDTEKQIALQEYEICLLERSEG